MLEWAWAQCGHYLWQDIRCCFFQQCWTTMQPREAAERRANTGSPNGLQTLALHMPRRRMLAATGSKAESPHHLHPCASGSMVHRWTQPPWGSHHHQSPPPALSLALANFFDTFDPDLPQLAAFNSTPPSSRSSSPIPVAIHVAGNPGLLPELTEECPVQPEPM